MFTGIIERVAKIAAVQPVAEAAGPKTSTRIHVETGFSDLALGESVAVNGTCLTVAALEPSGCADFFVSRETLDRTNLGSLRPGSRVNLERSVPMGGRLSGHWVQGHVDGLGAIVSVTPVGESHEVEVALPAALARYCVEKGSISINGTSLTINRVHAESSDSPYRISIVLIPHTWEHTNLSDLRPGDPVNVEVDILAKYLENLCKPSRSHLNI